MDAVPGLLYRKVTAAEASLLAGHLRRLDDRDWRARFQGSTDRDSVLRFVARFDWSEGAVIGAFVNDRLRGVAEVHPCATPSGPQAEIAVTVEGEFQNQGIGTELLRRAIDAARNRSIGRIHLLFLIDNDRMRRLVEKFSGAVMNDIDQSDGTIEPMPATFATLLEEWVEDADAVLADLARRLRPLIKLRPAPLGDTGTA
jgi:RimJ/RimL family protein N-acetyltransferase